MDKKISIILTTYNEAPVIEDTINLILKNLKNVEIVLLDDNSPDGTFEIVKKINNPNIIAYKRKIRGLGSAFLLGLINSSSEVVGWIDSNMGILANRLPEMLEKLNAHDIVILSRYVDGGNDLRSMPRVIASRLINLMCRILLSNKIKDYTSGIFLMRRSALLSAVPVATGHGEFFIEFIYKAQKDGIKIIELPYIQDPDIEGISKTASSLFRFCHLGINYIIRIVLTLLRRN